MYIVPVLRNAAQTSVWELSWKQTSGKFSNKSSELTNVGQDEPIYKCWSGWVTLQILVRMGQSVGTIGYKVDIPRAGLIFKGCVNSDWEVIVI